MLSDSDNSGSVDYYEFISQILPKDYDSSQKGAMMFGNFKPEPVHGVRRYAIQTPSSPNGTRTSRLINAVKAEINRVVSDKLGLSKKLASYDTEHIGSITDSEFRAAMKSFGIELTEAVWVHAVASHRPQGFEIDQANVRH